MTDNPNPLFPDHSMYADTVEAMKRYHQTQTDGTAIEDVERLRRIVESHLQSVTDYQLRALGRPGGSRH